MPGPLTLGEIASRLGGRVAGDPRTPISQVGSLERAGAGQITFVSSPRYKTKLATTRGAAIGDDSCLYPGVTVYPGCLIGARAIVHSGAVIGADGFGIAREGEGWVKIPQIGRVVIGDDVEIGANTTIDRGALDDTVLEEGVKLDNQIQIGHNVRVGAHTAMAGCVAVAGSADIGKRCTLGAAAVILGHLSIADDVHVSAGTVISRSIHRAGTYTGMFPFDENASWARNTALVRHLAELAERLRALERKGKDHG